MLVVRRPDYDGVNIVASKHVLVVVNLGGSVSGRVPDPGCRGFALRLPDVANRTHLRIGAVLKLQNLAEQVSSPATDDSDTNAVIRAKSAGGAQGGHPGARDKVSASHAVSISAQGGQIHVRCFRENNLIELGSFRRSSYHPSVRLTGSLCALVTVLALAAACYEWSMPDSGDAEARRPNVVFIFIDDLGYGDIGPFGSTVNKTPHLDRMAAEGLVLRQFYVSNTNCTPSRAALMTGTYAHRIGMDGDVLFPGERRGLHGNETTIAEIMKRAGYATGVFGKWHLGDQARHLPLEHGFDAYFGIPYSNDMWPGNLRGHRHTKEPYTPLPVIRDDGVVAYVADGADQALLCEAVTDAAIEFIEARRDEPFFVYLPHPYVHRPRYARPEIAGRANGNVNRAVVEEVDDSVGRVLGTLRALDLAEKTLVIFTSDNGGATGMSMGPLRGGKGGPKYEGHMRVPTISWWPGTIPAGGTTDEIVTAVDILPSLAALVGANLPAHPIDGKNALQVLLDKPGGRSPHELLFYEDEGVRRGDWKLVLGASGDFELYDLEADVGETTDLSAAHPALVKELRALLADHAAEIAANRRPAGNTQTARPLIGEPGDLPKLRDRMGVDDFEPVPERR